jgi:hypothetical protein
MANTCEAMTDGVHAMVPRAAMTEAARRRRDAYERVRGAPLYRTEFWLMEPTLEAWKAQGMPQDVPHHELFGFESSPGDYGLGQLGWCEAAFQPHFEKKLIEDRGETEIEQDWAGRHVLYFKGRRCGFMPEYVRHPVHDMKSWAENVKWRLDPSTPARYADLGTRMTQAKRAAAEGRIITQNLIGGYMYLRSLIGPEELLYAFYDQPELIHDCIRTWFQLADAVIARHQEHVTIDEIFLAEDICYNHGILIAPEMMKEFLLPYYQQLIANLRPRQIDRARHLHVQIDTDGDCRPTIDIYRDALGMDAMSPFEVASGCDVAEIGRRYPDLVMRGGLDKRVISEGKDAIDRMVERILIPLRERGGYIPSLDHGTPPETPYENYLHFRKRCLEIGQ